MPKPSINKAAVFIFIFIISVFAQVIFKSSIGWSPEFIMAALVTAVFYLNVLEMVLLSAFGIFMLNWQPVLGWEILLFFLMPFIIMAAKNIFPWNAIINSVFGTVLSITVFYGLVNWSAILSNPVIFAEVLMLTAIFSAVLFQISNYFYPTHQP